LIENFETHGAPVIGVQKVPKEHVDRYGIVKLKHGTREMEHVVEKPSIADAPSQLAQFGRMILTPEIVQILKETKLGKGNELWVTDAISSYIEKGGKFMVEEVEDGKWLTTGDPLNYLKAMIDYALIREDIGKDFRAHLVELLRA
jgi:UTP--glucose-1-phosphate uridylyltransferase